MSAFCKIIILLQFAILFNSDLNAQKYALKDGDIPTYRLDSTLKEVLSLDKNQNGFKYCFTPKENLSAKYEVQNNVVTGKVTYFGIEGFELLTYNPASDTTKRSLERHGDFFDYSLSYSFKYDSVFTRYYILLYPDGKIAARFQLSGGRTNIQPDRAWYFDKNGTEIAHGYFYNKARQKGSHVLYYDASFNINCSACYYHPAVIQQIVHYEEGKQISGKYFDKKGNLIGECTFNRGKPFQGKFLNVHELGIGIALESYEKGVKEGPEVEYTADMKVLQTIYYSKNEKIKEELGEVFDDLNIPKTGIYKDGEPWNGTFIFDDIAEYEEGIQKGNVIKLNLVTFKPISKSYMINRVKVGREEHYDISGKIISVGFYENNIPMNGTFITTSNNDKFVLDEYRNGDHSKRKMYKGCYFHQDKMDYDLLWETEFKQGKPWNGLHYDEKLSLNFNYKDGKKEGIAYRITGTDTLLIEHYQNDLLHGPKIEKDRYFPDKFKTNCIYEKGKLISGFIRAEGSTDETRYYSEGLLTKVFKEDQYKKTTYETANQRKNGKCLTELLATNEVLEGEYKDDKPWSGLILENNTICSYENGLKSGTCIEYNGSLNSIGKKTNYRNDLKHGPEIFYFQKLSRTSMDKDSMVSIYKDGEFEGGYKLVSGRDDYNDKYVRYESGAPTEDSLIIGMWEQAHYKGRKIVDGRFLISGSEMSIVRYTNGVRSMTASQYGHEVMSEKCEGNNCQGQNRLHQNYIWTITPDKKDLNLMLYKKHSGEPIDTAYLDDDFLVSGCIRFDHFSFNPKLSADWKSLRICKDKKHTILEIYHDDKYYLQYIIKDNIEVRYPEMYPYKFFNDHFEGRDYTCNAIDELTKEIIASAKFVNGSLYQGMHLEPQRNYLTKLSISEKGNIIQEMEYLDFRSLIKEIEKYKGQK